MPSFNYCGPFKFNFSYYIQLCSSNCLVPLTRDLFASHINEKTICLYSSTEEQCCSATAAAARNTFNVVTRPYCSVHR